MQYTIPAEFISRIQTLPDRASDPDAAYPEPGTRVLILDEGHALYLHDGTILGNPCDPELYEVDGNHIRRVALLDPPQSLDDHVLVIEDTPRNWMTPSDAGIEYEVTTRCTGNLRSVADSGISPNGRRPIGRRVAGGGRHDWLGTFVRLNPVGDTAPAASEPHVWAVGDRFSATRILGIGTYPQGVTGTVVRAGDLRATFDRDQTMDYPSVNTDGWPSWSMNEDYMTFLGRTADHTWAVGDKVKVNDLTDATVTGILRGEVVDAGSGGPTDPVRVRFDRSLGENTRDAVFSEDGWWVERSRVMLDGPTAAQPTPQPAVLVPGSRVRVNQSNHAIHGQVAEVVRSSGDPAFPYVLAYGGEEYLRVRAASITPVVEEFAIGDHVRITGHRDGRVYVGRTGVIEATRSIDERHPMGWYVRLDDGGGRVSQMTSMEKIASSPDGRPWQVGDVVRITDHPLTELVGRVGVITEVNIGREDGRAGVAVRQTSPEGDQRGTIWRDARGVALVDDDMSVGDRVRITSHHDSDLIGVVGTLWEIDRGARPGAGRWIIARDPGRPGRPVLRNALSIEPENEHAENTAVTESTVGVTATGASADGSVLVGDVVRLTRVPNRIYHEGLEGLVIRVGNPDDPRGFRVHTREGVVSDFEAWEVVHRRERLAPLASGERWDRMAQTIPVADIQAVTRLAGITNGESTKADLLCAGLPYGVVAYGRSVYDVLTGEPQAEFRNDTDARRWMESRPTRETYTWSEVRRIATDMGQGRFGWCSVAVTTLGYLEPVRPAAAPAGPRIVEHPETDLRYWVMNANGSEYGRFARQVDAEQALAAMTNPF